MSGDTIFCADISGQASVSVPASSLKRECWTGGANTAISAGEIATVSRIELAVYTNPTSSVPFDYCLAALSIGSPPTVTITGQGSFAISPTFFGANYWCWMDRYGNDLESIKSQVADLGLRVLRAGGHNLDINGGVSGTSYELDPFDDAQIDTFVAYAQSIGAEAILQVPLLKDTSGNPATAAAAAHMVTYANITKRYGIRYWIIGNEPDIYVSQGDQPSSYSVSDYCASVTSYVAAMKAVDPTIKLLGPELAWAGSAWLASVLTTCGAQFDIITVHRYPFDPAAATFASAQGDAPNFRATIDDLRAVMTSAGLRIGGAAGAVGTGGRMAGGGATSAGGVNGRGGITSTGGVVGTGGASVCTICNGICVDIETDIGNCGECGRACSAVSPATAVCTAGRCLVTLASGRERIWPDIAIDGASVYWTEHDGGIPVWPGSGDGRVMKVPVGGGTATMLASKQDYL